MFKFSCVTILQGVEFPIFLLIFAWTLQQSSAMALPVISDMRRDIADVRAATPRVIVATTAISSDRFDGTSVPDMTSEVLVTAAQALSAARQSGAIQRNNTNAKHRTSTVVGKATNKKLKVVTNRRKIDVFATRLSPDTSVSEVCSYAADAIEDVCGTRLLGDSLQCEKLVTRFQTYSSFWLSCVVEADMYDKTSILLLSEEAWPAGVLVRKYYPKHNG